MTIYRCIYYQTEISSNTAVAHSVACTQRCCPPAAHHMYRSTAICISTMMYRRW